MPTCYQLVGVPASGKTTWAESQIWACHSVTVSTDEFVEDYARECGQTYREVFDDYMPTAIDLMIAKVKRAQEAGLDIIWDQTSTSRASRSRKFKMLPNYQHVAVVFKTPEKEELIRRLKSRPGKEIPDEIVQDMITHFEMPTLDEGFAEIWHAQ